MSNDETVTIRVWRGSDIIYARDPDETHEVAYHNGDYWNAETAQLGGISPQGWLAFDLVDLPQDMDTATLFVHQSNSPYKDPLDNHAVERGLVFDGRPYKPGVNPPCFHLEGEVIAHVARGSL